MNLPQKNHPWRQLHDASPPRTAGIMDRLLQTLWSKHPEGIVSRKAVQTAIGEKSTNQKGEHVLFRKLVETGRITIFPDSGPIRYRLKPLPKEPAKPTKGDSR